MEADRAEMQETLFSHALLEKLIAEFGLYRRPSLDLGWCAIDEMQKRDIHFNAREGYSFRVAFTPPSRMWPSLSPRASQLLIQAQLDASAQKAQETRVSSTREEAR